MNRMNGVQYECGMSGGKKHESKIVNMKSTSLYFYTWIDSSHWLPLIVLCLSGCAHVCYFSFLSTKIY